MLNETIRKAAKHLNVTLTYQQHQYVKTALEEYGEFPETSVEYMYAIIVIQMAEHGQYLFNPRDIMFNLIEFHQGDGLRIDFENHTVQPQLYTELTDALVYSITSRKEHRVFVTNTKEDLNSGVETV